MRQQAFMPKQEMSRMSQDIIHTDSADITAKQG